MPPQGGTTEEEEPEIIRTFAVWDDTNVFVTYQVYNTSEKVNECFGIQQVLLDNQADVNVFHPMWLRAVQKDQVKVKVNGLEGKQLTITDTGY
jgi:hypothetical protein